MKHSLAGCPGDLHTSMGELGSCLGRTLPRVYLLQISPAGSSPPRGAGLCPGLTKLGPPSCGCSAIAANQISGSQWSQGSAGSKCTATAIYVANAKDQSAMVVTENFFFPSSFFSSVSLSKAHSNVSGRRSPRSTYLPDLILRAKGSGMPNNPVMGNIRVGGSLEAA